MEIRTSKVGLARPIGPLSGLLELRTPAGAAGSWVVNPSGGFTYIPPGSPISPRGDEIGEAAKTLTLETIEIAELDKTGVLRSSLGLGTGPFGFDDLDALLRPDSNKLVESLKLLDKTLGAIPTSDLTVTGISAIVGGASYLARLASGDLSVVEKRLGWCKPLCDLLSVAAAVSGSQAAAQTCRSAGQAIGILVSVGKFAYVVYEVGARPPQPLALVGQGVFAPLARKSIQVHA